MSEYQKSITMKHWKITTLLVAIVLLNACVTKKEYALLESRNRALQGDVESLSNARQERQKMADSLSRTNVALQNAQNEMEEWKNRYISIYNTNEEIQKEVGSLRYQNQQLQDAASRTNDVLRREIADRLKELDAREKDLRMLEANLKTSQGSIEDLRKVLTEKEIRIKQLSDALTEKDAQMNALRQKVAEVLKGFNANELTVRQENGKIYVVLSEGLLFAKGSSVVGTRGIDAVKKLSAALSSADVDIEVEGHTDTDGNADMNWQLSQARALSVVRILGANRVDAKRMTASGRAFYRPVAPNDVEANKAKNRRTEIILSPKLDALYELIKSK